MSATFRAGAGIGVAVLTFGVYMVTLAPSIVIGDSGELITAAATLGIPHPPGYPLWCLVMRLFTLLPFGSPALDVNIGSALFGAVAAWLFFRLATGPGEIPVRIAAPLTLAHGLTPALWSQAVVAEVYAFNLTIVLFLCLAFQSKGRITRLIPFAAGIALITHGTNGFVLVPIALAGVGTWLRTGATAGRVVRVSAAFALGLSPLLYLPLRSHAGPVLDWGHPADLAGFLAHVGRREYGGFAWPGIQTWAAFQRNWLVVGTIGGSILIWVLAATAAFPRARSSATRMWWAWLVMSGPVAATALVGLLRDEQLYECRVFFLPFFAFLLLLAGRGLATLGLRFQTAVSGLLLAWSAWLFVDGRPAADKSGNWIAHDFGRAILDAVPDDAVLFVVGDHEAFPIMYLQTVGGFRPGVSVRPVRSSKPLDAYGHSAPSLESVIRDGSRPVYVTLATPPFPPDQCVPQGPVLRVGSGSPRWRSVNVRYRPCAELDHFERATLAMIRYHEADYLFATHRIDEALAQTRRAAAFAPGNPRVLNNIASLLARHRRDDAAASMWAQAIQADPRLLASWENAVRLELNRGHVDEARTLIERARRFHPDAPGLKTLEDDANRTGAVR